MADEIDRLTEAVAIDQIILRSFLIEFAKHRIEASQDPDAAKRELLNRLYEAVDHYRVPGASDDALEDLKEKARGNIDALLGALRPF